MGGLVKKIGEESKPFLEQKISEKAPIISVLIPVYNVEDYLLSCLDSVFSQTFTDYEVICVDDGSTDKSGDILDEYTSREVRMKVIHQQNLGQSAARNTALKHARGEYIHFLDSDDLIHPQLLEIVFFFAEEHGAELVCFQDDRNNGFGWGESAVYHEIEKIPFRLTDNPLSGFKRTKRRDWKMRYGPCCKLYRRDLLKDIEFLECYFEDIAFTLLLCRKHPKTVLLNEILYYYTVRDSSTMGQVRKRILPEHIQAYHRVLSAVYEGYKGAPAGEAAFIAKEIVFLLLKQQLKNILRADREKQKELYDAFIAELVYLDNKGLVRFDASGVKYWLKFKSLIRKGK
jgi:glycosyltransferase involved in cell wall biosynthesis